MMDNLKQFALSLPEVTEGTACKNIAYKADGKRSFLFIGTRDAVWEIRLKLQDSLPEARELAGTGQHDCSVGATNWISISPSKEGEFPGEMLQRWAEESFRLLAPKKLVNRLDSATCDSPPISR